jgi:CubicO group peptidase (beta-lactamase class C family)
MIPADIDSLAQQHLTQHNITGLSLAVARKGELLHAAGYGLANLEHRAPATADTVYQTASVGKQFTAALVMMLVERGRIGIDEFVLPLIPDAPPEWDGITIRHLLTHTSGVSDLGLSELNYRLEYADEEIFKAVAIPPLEFEPGTQWNYSNAGYTLLGLLIGRVTGRFYGDLLREWVFDPLGMTTARAVDEADIIPNRAAGYRMEDGRILNHEYVSATLNRTADGGLYISVADLAKWDRELAGGSLLTPASREAMWTPVRLTGGEVYKYGFGWEIGFSSRGRVVQHDGEWQGFSTHFRRYLDDGLSVMVLSNLAGAPVSELADSIVRAA